VPVWHGIIVTDGVQVTMLMNDVINLEQEAAAILSAAQEEVGALERGAEEELRAFRQNVVEETDRRIGEFRRTIEEKQTVSLAQAEKELKSALDGIDVLPETLLQTQVDLVLARLNEL